MSTHAVTVSINSHEKVFSVLAILLCIIEGMNVVLNPNNPKLNEATIPSDETFSPRRYLHNTFLPYQHTGSQMIHTYVTVYHFPRSHPDGLPSGFSLLLFLSNIESISSHILVRCTSAKSAVHAESQPNHPEHLSPRKLYDKPHRTHGS